jgi:hypothetical protein
MTDLPTADDTGPLDSETQAVLMAIRDAAMAFAATHRDDDGPEARALVAATTAAHILLRQRSAAALPTGAGASLRRAFYGPDEIATITGLTLPAVMALIGEGRLAHVTIDNGSYRVPRKSVLRLIDPRAVRPPIRIDIYDFLVEFSAGGDDETLIDGLISMPSEVRPRDEIAIDLVALEALARHSVAGPWWTQESDDAWQLFAAAGEPAGHGFQIIKAAKHGTPYAEYWPTKADAEYLVAVLNAAPTLIAAARRGAGREDAPI